MVQMERDGEAEREMAGERWLERDGWRERQRQRERERERDRDRDRQRDRESERESWGSESLSWIRAEGEEVMQEEKRKESKEIEKDTIQGGERRKKVETR